MEKSRAQGHCLRQQLPTNRTSTVGFQPKKEGEMAKRIVGDDGLLQASLLNERSARLVLANKIAGGKKGWFILKHHGGEKKGPLLGWVGKGGLGEGKKIWTRTKTGSYLSKTTISSHIAKESSLAIPGGRVAEGVMPRQTSRSIGSGVSGTKINGSRGKAGCKKKFLDPSEVRERRGGGEKHATEIEEKGNEAANVNLHELGRGGKLRVVRKRIEKKKRKKEASWVRKDKERTSGPMTRGMKSRMTAQEGEGREKQRVNYRVRTSCTGCSYRTGAAE